jgi:glycosyltransferase involved in cell wall biosynthesis
MKLSVILPVYNVEKYIAEALDSVLAQTAIKDMEIILVDDRGSDKSWEIAQKYISKNSCIKAVRHEKNMGLSSARNTGLAAATGEFVGFMDTDDYISADYFEKLLAAAKKHCADMVCSSIMKVSEDGKPLELMGCGSGAEKDTAGKIRRLHVGSVWDKIFRRELLIKNNLQFPVGRLYEDNFLLIKALTFAGTVAYVKDAVYFYRQRPNSICSRKDAFYIIRQRSDIFLVARQILNFIRSGSYGKDAEKEAEIFTYARLKNNDALNHYKRHLVDVFGVKNLKAAKQAYRWRKIFK